MDNKSDRVCCKWFCDKNTYQKQEIDPIINRKICCMSVKFMKSAKEYFLKVFDCFMISKVLSFIFGISKSGWPRHRENREFGSYFFQTGKTQGICQKILKIWFYTGNLPSTRKILKFQKLNVKPGLWWNIAIKFWFFDAKFQLVDNTIEFL